MTVPNPAMPAQVAVLPLYTWRGRAAGSRWTTQVLWTLVPTFGWIAAMWALGPVLPTAVLGIPGLWLPADASTVLSTSTSALLMVLVLAQAVLGASRRSVPVVATIFGVAAAVVGTGVATAVLGPMTPAQPWAVAVALAMIVATAVVFAWLVARSLRRPLGARDAGIVGARLALPPTSAAAWIGSAANAGMLWLSGIGLMLIAAYLVVVVVQSAPWMLATAWIAILAACVVVAALPAFAIRCTVDRRGLRVRSRVLGLPLATIPLADVARAEAVRVRAEDWRGPGTFADHDRSAIIPRSGPALIVTRTDGSELVVGVDRPDEAAAVLMTLIDRRG